MKKRTAFWGGAFFVPVFSIGRGVFNAKPIKNYICLYPIHCIGIISLVLLFVVGIGCYYAGHNGAERDVELERVQSVIAQLESAQSEQLSKTQNLLAIAN